MLSPCRKRSPAKGAWQKSDEKNDRSIRKCDQKVTEIVPKTQKVIETIGDKIITYHCCFLFLGGIIFGNYYRKLYGMIFLGELITVM